MCGSSNGGVVDVLTIARQHRLHGKFLHVDVGLHQGSQVRREDAYLGRLHPVRVDQAGHFDAAACGQVFNKPAVRYVAVDAANGARLEAVDDARAVFGAPPHLIKAREAPHRALDHGRHERGFL